MDAAPQPAIAQPETDLLTLQHVIFPEPGICTEIDLYFHLSGPAGFRQSDLSIRMETGAELRFDTYFNAFSLGKWHEAGGIETLLLGLSGRGDFAFKVYHAIPDRSWEVLISDVITLEEGQEHRLDLSHFSRISTQGVIFFQMIALGEAVFAGGRWMTAAPAGPRPGLALSITTFRREDAVQETTRRLHAYLADSVFGDNIHVFVIDNGDSAEIAPSPHITRLPNANLGGAGGFTRGLLEAEAAGFTHVLFMDDDASYQMESLHRTYAFLAISKNPKAAVAGAMINNTEKWKMWENGAVFDQKCLPRQSGTDLRDPMAVMQMEFVSAREPDPKLYGGWWHFAFPIAQVKRHPFPFFVRGDDVNFSLVNDFRITVLNGVVCFQDDFTDKESPLTWYLDFRSHMVHHLTLEKMEVPPRRLVRMAVWFFLRNLVKCQYETIEAVLLAFEDVMRGPDFFVENADMAERRARIKALARTEHWQPVETLDTSERRRFDGARWLTRRFFQLTLNGHLLPFFSVIGNRVVVPPKDRGNYLHVYGSYRFTFLNSTRDMGYMTVHSKRRAAGLAWRLATLSVRFLRDYSRLKALYRRRYPEITTRGFWTETLQVTPGRPPLSDPAVSDPPAAE